MQSEMLKNYRLNRKTFGMNAFICTLVCVLFVFTSCTKNDDEANIQQLEELKQAYLWNNSTDKGLIYLNRLKEEALKQKNHRYVGTYYYYLSNYYRSDPSKGDSVFYALQQAKMYYKKGGYKRGEILAETRTIDVLTLDKGYDLALDMIYPLLTEATQYSDDYLTAHIYSSLGKIYLFSAKYNEALQTYEEALKFYEKANKPEEIMAEYNNVIYFQALTANMAKKHELSLSYCQSYKENLEKESASEFSKKQNLYFIDILVADNMLEMNQIKEAELVIDKLRSYFNENQNMRWMLETDFIALLSSYYLHTQHYNKALQLINSIDYSALNETNYLIIINQKADILTAKGDYKDAISLKNQIYNHTDSIQKLNRTKQLGNLKQTLQLEMLVKENQLKERYTLIIIVSLSIVCLLLILVLYLKLRNSKRLKKKNELLFSQYKNLDKCTHTTSKLEVDDDIEKSIPEATLFKKAEAYLLSNELFRDPDISRESLALDLGTNRQYLTQAIQENTGMTFMEYINEMKLEFARRLLCYDTDLPIDEVYIASGFNSKSTFYRLFKQKYDLTPKEIRDIAIQKKQ